jgi:PAS domain S-box-containing protein
MASPPNADTIQKELGSLRAEVAALRTRLEAAESETAQLRGQRDRARSEIARLRENANRIDATIQSLKESEARYRILSGASLAGVYVLDNAGRIVYANPQALQLLGYSLEEIVGRNVLEIVAEDNRAEVAENVQRRLEGQVSSVHYKARMLHRDGSPRDWEIWGSRAVFEGKPAIIGTVLDRTDAVRSERALAASEARFQAFMQHTPTIAFMRDDSGRFVFANRAFYEFSGLAEETTLGKGLLDVFPAEQAGFMIETDRQVLATGRSVEVSNRLRNTAGEERYLTVLKFALEEVDGRRCVGGIAFDITGRIRAEEDLAGQKHLLQSILDSMGEGVAATDEKGAFVIFNPSAHRITGTGPVGSTPEEWTVDYGILQADGKTPFRPDDLPLTRALRGESTDSVEMLLRNPNNSAGTWVSVTGRPLVDERGRSRGAVVVFRDTSERRRTLERLMRAEAKYRELVEQLPAVTYIATFEEPYPTVFISPQIQRLLGFTPAEWIADPESWVRRLHPEDRDRVLTELEFARKSRSRFVCDYRLIARDGGVRWVHDEAVVILNDDDDAPSQYQGVVLDITERETERELRQRLWSLSRQMVAIQEAERRRTGLELHDEIGQILTGLKLKVEVARSTPAPELEGSMREMELLIDEAIERVRELSQNLRPTVLDDLGLLPALISSFGRYGRQTGIHVVFEHSGIEGRRFDSEIETAAYRIVQEALTNVARHAQVKTVRVRAWSDERVLGVRVEDDGSGFDIGHILGKDKSQGLAGMRERAALLHGVLTVDSTPGRGCRVTGELPLEGAAASGRKDIP